MLFWIVLLVVAVWLVWVFRQMPLTWWPMTPITVRSAAIGAGTAVVAAGALAFLGVPPGLSALAGLPAGGLALAVAITMGDSRFDFMGPTVTRRRAGLWLLIWIVMAGPGFLVGSVVDLDRISAMALQVLVLSTGFAAYAFGGIMATMEHLDGEGAADDPRLHVLTPSPRDRRPARPGSSSAAGATGDGR